MFNSSKKLQKIIIKRGKKVIDLFVLFNIKSPPRRTRSTNQKISAPGMINAILKLKIKLTNIYIYIYVL